MRGIGITLALAAAGLTCACASTGTGEPAASTAGLASGEVALLSDARLGPGAPGARTGIYLVAPRADHRTPVVFVSDADGSPRDFAPLIEALDTKRFEAWLWVGPAVDRPGGLERSAAELEALLDEMCEKHGVDGLALVANGTGGLLARATTLLRFDRTGRDDVAVLFTLGTPWDGEVRQDVPDAAPGSVFLDGLFRTASERRKLPARTAHHLIFAFGEERGGPPSDGKVTLRSALRAEAQEEARSMRGHPVDHGSLVASRAVREHLATILDEALTVRRGPLPSWKR